MKLSTAINVMSTDILSYDRSLYASGDGQQFHGGGELPVFGREAVDEKWGGRIVLRHTIRNDPYHAWGRGANVSITAKLLCRLQPHA